MLVTKQLTAATDLHGIFSPFYKSMATVSCLVTNILQNIFSAQQKQETRKCLERAEGSKFPAFKKKVFSWLYESYI